MTQDRLAVHLVSAICFKLATKVLVGKACLRIPGLAGLQDLKNEQEGLATWDRASGLLAHNSGHALHDLTKPERHSASAGPVCEEFDC